MTYNFNIKQIHHIDVVSVSVKYTMNQMSFACPSHFVTESSSGAFLYCLCKFTFKRRISKLHQSKTILEHGTPDVFKI